MKLKMILAVDSRGGIGKADNLPWRLPADLKHFAKITTGKGLSAVFMGRKTWESIPEKFRPLKVRLFLSEAVTIFYFRIESI